MPVRKPVKSARPVRRLTAKRNLAEELPIESAQEIRHHHNMIDLKVAIALAFVVVSSMVINVYAQTPVGGVASTTSTTGTVPVQTARLYISATSDSTTASKIMAPATSPVQVAKWTVTAENEVVSLQRVRFNIVNADYSIRYTASEFGAMNLYAGDGVTLLAQSVPVLGRNNGYVEFSGFNLEIQPGQPQTLSLRAVISGSGIMKPNSMVRFGINSSSLARWQGVSVNTGAVLAADKIKPDTTVYGIGGPTPLNLFHNTAPVAHSQSLDSVLALNSTAKIFKFSITNPGDREMRISRLMIKTVASGLNNQNKPTTTGYITGFKLYEANSYGELGTQLASSGNCLISPTAFGPKLGTAIIPGVGTCSLSSLFVNFDQKNDLDNHFDNFTISAGSSRSFVLTADTSNSLVGKMSGAVSLNAQLSGGTGTFPSSDPKQAFWAGGGIYYHYTPVNGVANAFPYNQSDSYSVVGPTLVRSI